MDPGAMLVVKPLFKNVLDGRGEKILLYKIADLVAHD